MNIHRDQRVLAGVAAAIAGSVLLAACGTGTPAASGASTPTTATTATTASAAPGGTAAPSPASGGNDTVLPVPSDPIINSATEKRFTIDQVLVENNVDASGATVDDHLEIALTNTSQADLGNFEVFYTFTDTVSGDSESYYAKLPPSFTIPAGGSRAVNFDNSGVPDHVPVNKFSLYATSVNALDVKVEVSADGAAVQTATVQKDAGGAETAD